MQSRIQSAHQAIISARSRRLCFQAGQVIFWCGYLVFPFATGAWWHSRIDCVFPWSVLVKNALSMMAYTYIGFMLAAQYRPREQRADVRSIGGAISVVLASSTGFDTWEKCF